MVAPVFRTVRCNSVFVLKPLPFPLRLLIVLFLTLSLSPSISIANIPSERISSLSCPFVFVLSVSYYAQSLYGSHGCATVPPPCAEAKQAFAASPREIQPRLRSTEYLQTCRER
jgi:hypothetical protein